MDALLIVFGMTIMYAYQRYRERVYKRKVRPLGYFSDVLAISVKAVDDNPEVFQVVRLTSPANRERLPYQMVNQTMVELVNTRKLPDGYMGRFFEHLMPEGMGSAPLWLDRVTLVPTTTSIKVSLDVASTDRAHLIKYNPKLIKGDQLASTLNYYFGLLEKK